MKTTVDFVDGNLHLRIAIGGGGGVLVIPNAVYASGHLDIVLYNNGLGSPKPSRTARKVESDFIGSFTLTGGGSYRFRSGEVNDNKYIPLYYFSNLNRHPLQNPFRYSLSLGTNLVFNPNRRAQWQRVGFANGNIDGFELTYYNDGTPFQRNLGDGHDRYYTGGGIISYNGSRNAHLNFFEIAYFKYTGFQPQAFEAANALDFAYVSYNDPNQQQYNKSLLSFGIGSNEHYWRAGVNLYNHTRGDVQHKIHKAIFNGYHRVPHESSFTPYVSVTTFYSKIGVK